MIPAGLGASEAVICHKRGGRHLKDAAADGHVAGEGALLVHVVALPRRLRGLEPKADILHEPHALVLRARDKDPGKSGMREDPILHEARRWSPTATVKATLFTWREREGTKMYITQASTHNVLGRTYVDLRQQKINGCLFPITCCDI